MTWDAFISYSHSIDDQLAPALQSGLQRLACPWYRMRSLHIFLDRTALSADPRLWGRIVAALDDARYLVLLMSPQSAGSTWVNREIEHWLATKGIDRLLPVLTEGALEWDPERGDFDPERSPSLPPALAGAFAEEPRYVDLRWAREGVHLDLRQAAFLDAVADLSAPIHGKLKDELVGEDVRRHRQTKRVVEAVVITLLALLAATAWYAYRAEQRRIDAVAQRLLVQSKGAGDTPELAFLLAAEAHRMRPGPQTEGGLVAALQVHQERELRRLWRASCTIPSDGDATAYSVLLLPDRGWAVYGDGNGLVAFADTETGAIVRHVSLGAGQAVVSLHADPGRDRIIAVTTVGVYYLPLQEARFVHGPMAGEQGFLDSAFDAKTGQLAIWRIAGPLDLWDTVTGERLRRIEWPDDRATSAAFHPTEPILFVGTTAGKIHALPLDAQSDGTWTVPNAHGGGTLALAVKPDGSQLLSGGADGVVRLWDAKLGTKLYERRSHTASVWDLGFTVNHPKGSYIASVGPDGDLSWIDAKTLIPYPPTRVHQGRINDLDLAADGTYATAGADGVIALFDANRPFLAAGRQFNLGAPVSSIAVHPSGEQFAMAFGAQGKLAILDGASGSMRVQPFAAGSPIALSAYHPTGRYLALGTADGRVLLWTPGASDATTYTEHSGEIVDLAFSPDGRRLATLGGDGRVLQWTVTDTGLAPPQELERQGWRALAFSHDGALMAIGRTDGSIRVIRSATGEDAALLQDDPPIFPTKLAFHPQRPLLAAGDGYGKIRLWNSQTFTEQPPPLTGHRGEINGIAFDAQRNRLIASGRDAEVRLWDLDSGSPVAVLGGHQGVIRTLAYSSTRSEVASGGLDGLAIIRSVSTEQWIDDGCRLYGRDFKPEETLAYGLESNREPLCRPELLCPPIAPAAGGSQQGRGGPSRE